MTGNHLNLLREYQQVMAQDLSLPGGSSDGLLSNPGKGLLD